MAHYQYTQEENVAFTSCKRKVVKLLKPANEATERGVVQRGGGLSRAAARKGCKNYSHEA